MPTEEENVQYLYLVLTHGGAPTIDWDAVGAAMELNKGAVSKRWSRLKKSMEKGETPSGSVYRFLWLCVKHSTRDKVMNWSEIAEQCGTTSGAASKRYSRMKQAYEADGDAPGSNPTSPAPKTPSKATPRKKKAAAAADEDGEATPTPKRKRASPKKKAINGGEVSAKPEAEGGEDEESDGKKQSAKKAKVTRAKVTPKPEANGKPKGKKDADLPLPTTEATTVIKNEIEDKVEDPFLNAEEWVNDLVEDNGDDEDQAGRVNGWLSETV